jgi:hypothetical protein
MVLKKMESSQYSSQLLTYNNPGFTFYYMIILFPINC